MVFVEINIPKKMFSSKQGVIFVFSTIFAYLAEKVSEKCTQLTSFSLPDS